MAQMHAAGLILFDMQGWIGYVNGEIGLGIWQHARDGVMFYGGIGGGMYGRRVIGRGKRKGWYCIECAAPF